MSAKPTGSLAMTHLWCESAPTRIVVPATAKQQAGWTTGERPPAQYQNWFANRVDTWLRYLSDGDCQFHDLSATGTFSAVNAAVTGNETVGGTLGVTGNTTVGGTLDVTGNGTVGGTLGVTGAATLGGGAVVPSAASVHGMSTTRSYGFNGYDWHEVAGTSASGVIMVDAYFCTSGTGTYGHKLGEHLSAHETLTGLTLYADDATSAANITDIKIKYVTGGSSGGGIYLNVTGLTFTRSGNAWTMSGTPSVALQPVAGTFFWLQITTSSPSKLSGLALTVNT